MGAGRNRLRCTFDVNQTHATVCRDTQLFVIAEARHVDADIIGHLDDHLALARFNRLAVDFYIYNIVTHSDYAAASVVASTMLRPLLRIMYSNSCI